MEKDYAECPAYKSKTYYGVVIRTEKHKGWCCTYCGDGLMKFQHDSGEQREFYRGRAGDWMERCWADFLAMAERHNV